MYIINVKCTKYLGLLTLHQIIAPSLSVSGLWGHDDLDPVLTKRIARAGA